MEYADFELMATDVQVIEEENTSRIAFKVQIPRSPAGEITEGVPSAYDIREMREFLVDFDDHYADWPKVIEAGYWLGTVIFPPEVHSLLVRSLDLVEAQKRGLRIRLLLENELHNLPWEYVLINRGGKEATVADFLALMPNVSIVRHQAATLPAWDIKAELPVRMVAALASPCGYKALKLDEERKAIQQALEGNPHIKTTFVPNARPETLLSGVEKAHLFHFAGHGDLDKDTLSAQPGKYEGEGFIILDNGRNAAVQFNAGQLALRLRQAGVRVAVLGACRSGRRDDVNTWSSVATALLKAGLGAVVGMQYTIRDKNAIAFAGVFYKALLAGLPIDEAVTAGRLAVSPLDAQDWGVPVLYLRAPDGVVFPEYAADATLEEVRNEIRVTARQRIKELHGKAITVDISRMTEGTVEAEQNIDVVKEGGEATTVKIKELGGSTVGAKQEVNRVEKDGIVTATRIDKLGCGLRCLGGIDRWRKQKKILNRIFA